MANKKKIEARLEAERQARQTRIIQIAGIAVVLIVVVAGAWWLTPTSSEVDAGITDGACAPFADIHVAAQYTAPEMRIDTAGQYFANVKMAKGGEFLIQLYPDKAPITVNNFVFLACKGFYDGSTFHRVIDGFMAQGGDPTGTGTSGPGYQFVNEKNDLAFDQAGVVAMANAGLNTNGSQFFIMFNAYGLTEDSYTIFGQVVEGMEVVNGIRRRDPQSDPLPGDAMESVTISEK